jgi:hypothetical protein
MPVPCGSARAWRLYLCRKVSRGRVWMLSKLTTQSVGTWSWPVVGSRWTQARDACASARRGSPRRSGGNRRRGPLKLLRTHFEGGG